VIERESVCVSIYIYIYIYKERVCACIPGCTAQRQS